MELTWSAIYIAHQRAAVGSVDPVPHSLIRDLDRESQYIGVIDGSDINTQARALCIGRRIGAPLVTHFANGARQARRHLKLRRKDMVSWARHSIKFAVNIPETRNQALP